MSKTPLSLTITASGSKAQIRLVGEIYEWRNSASTFEEQVNALIEKGIQDAELYIFTNGGDVVQANEIANIIKRFPGEIHGVGGAMVASAGSYIAVKCKTFKMPSNGILMIHKPELNAYGNEDSIGSGVDYLKNITAEYRKAYSAKTGLSDEQIEALWKSECYMTAQMAMEKKFCDGIIEEENVPTEVADQIIASWNRLTIPTALFNWAKNLKDKNQSKQNNQTNMKKIAAALKKDENSSEEQLAQYAGELVIKNQELTAKMEKLENKEKEAQKSQATAAIDAAVKDGRLEATAKDSWTKMFDANHESAMAAINALKPRQKVAEMFGKDDAKESDKKILAMSWDELDRSSKLAEIKASRPDFYKEKFKEKFGREPKL